MQWVKMKLYTHSVGFQEEHFMSTIIYTMFSTFLTWHYYIPLSFSIWAELTFNFEIKQHRCRVDEPVEKCIESFMSTIKSHFWLMFWTRVEVENNVLLTCQESCTWLRRNFVQIYCGCRSHLRFQEIMNEKAHYQQNWKEDKMKLGD